MKALFVGGGTLGSLNPLLAVGLAVKQARPDVSVTFWTSRDALEQSLVREAGFPVATIIAGKFRRYFSVRNFFDLFVVTAAFFDALLRLRRHRPSVVVSAGSFVAVSVVFAARALRIPIVVYQQDVSLGLANQLMSRVATVRTATTPDRAKLFTKPAEVVGFALRPDLLTGQPTRVQAKYKLQPGVPTLLVVGGSSGAQALNELVVQSLPQLPTELNILHIVGRGKSLQAQRQGYVQVPFTNVDLPDLYATATLVLSRAGSNVLAELVALQKPAIIVPLPNTHQEANVRELKERGAVVLAQESLTSGSLAEIIRSVSFDPKQLAAMTKAVQGLWDTQGASKLAAIVTRFV